MNLTQADIYKALAANPFGKGPNKAQTWKDVNPALPAMKIRVLGPPPTSGTRDSLADLYLDQGLRHRSGDEGARRATRTSTRTSAPRSARTAPMSKPARTTICSCRRSPPTRARSASLAIPISRRMPTRCAPVQIAGVVADRSDDRRPELSGRAQALHLREGRASARPSPSCATSSPQYAKMWGKGGPLERAAWCRSAAPTRRARSRRPSSSRSIRRGLK